MRTKIIVNIGPHSESEEKIAGLIESGMDIARMNFSHCTYEEFLSRTAIIRAYNKKHGTSVKVLQDLKGPRLRVGKLPDEGRELKEGEKITFTTNGNTDPEVIHIDDPYLHLDIKKGAPLYLVNAQMELIVDDVKGSEIYTTVIRGGRLFSNKAVNVPGTKLTTSGLTEKDIEDVKFALDNNVDYIALSFVQTEEDIIRLREIVGTKAKIIAKIETAIALDHIDGILREADGIMIARGDLGVEMPLERVPIIQKHLARLANWAGKPSIVATQMLASMIDHPQPTRAEVSDIANAIIDGADAVMLSDETSIGNYPLESVQTLVKVVNEAENYLFNRENRL